MRRVWATLVLLVIGAGLPMARPGASAAAVSSPATVSMAFSGDILMHRPLLAQALEYGGGRYDFAPMFARIAPILSSVDVAYCHLETPIAPPGEPLSFHPIYGVPHEVVDGIAASGFDRCSTASNHSFDRGLSGIDATVDALEAAGIGSAGMARTPEEAAAKLYTANGIRFAQLAYTYGLNGLVLPPGQPWRVRLLDADRIIADATEARARGAEYVIVNLHWGAEKNWQITAEQRSLAERLTASGVIDLIVGEHVHVLQPVEQVNGVWVVYGMSNLISNLPGGADFPDAAQDGALFTLSVTRAADGSFTTTRPVAHPTWVDHSGYVIRPVLEDLADPSTPAGVRGVLQQSLARTRAVLGSYVAAAPLGVVPLRCSVTAPADAPVTGFTVDTSTARYVPSDPVRIFDSRDAGDAGYVCPGATVTVPVAGRGGVPSAGGATAAVLNVTATAAGGAGFVTVWPAGTARPTVSSLNLTAVGQTRPNLVIVPLGEGGAVNVFSQSGVHVVVDVAGWFVPAATADAGRFVPLTPARLLDTRGSSGAGARLPAGGVVDVPAVGHGGVPPSGVAAVVVTITGTDATGPGFLTAWPTGAARPLASNVNLGRAGETAPNLAIVRVGTGGAISVYSQAAAHVVVDVAGYLTDDTALAVSAGLFVPVAPARVLDTRESGAAPASLPTLGGAITVQHTGVAGVPTERVGAVAVNVTAVDTAAEGFVTVWPAGASMPTTSSLNVGVDDTRAGAAVMKLGDGGAVSIFSQRGAHLVSDVFGWFTSAA